MVPHGEREVCLKEEQWKDVHDFIAATKPYRISLDKSIDGVRNGMWAVALAVLVPFILGLVWIGEVKNEVRRNTNDIQEVKVDLKEHMRIK